MKKLLALVSIIALLTLAGCDFSFTKQDDDTPSEADRIEVLEAEIAALKEGLEPADEDREESERSFNVGSDDTSSDDDSDDTTPPTKTAAQLALEAEAAAAAELEAARSVAATYVGANYITLNTPAPNASTFDTPVEYIGVVSPNTTKIEVTAQGGSQGNYYYDNYTLVNFNLGDTTFTYRADLPWGNLGNGKNDYTFKAYFFDGTSKSTSISNYYHR